MVSMLLDTNVVSELMRPRPAPAVLGWFAQQENAHFFISAITRAEIMLGIAMLPAGKRRDDLAVAAEQMFAEDFADRCLAFDTVCADEYAWIVAWRTQRGRAISTEDAQIAAIALAHNQVLVTRNGKDFLDIDGLMVVDPWM